MEILLYMISMIVIVLMPIIIMIILLNNLSDYADTVAKFLDIPIDKNDRDIIISSYYNNNKTVPNTVQFIDEGYLHRCRDGSPDLRFKHNPYIKEHYIIILKIDKALYIITIYNSDKYKIIKDAITKKGIQLLEI